MRQTSIMAFESIQEALGKKQRMVLDAISSMYCPNNREIAEYLGVPINTVTPRVNELVKKGIVFDAGLKEDVVTHRMTLVWRSMDYGAV